MLQIEFTQEDKQTLQHERFEHPHPRVQRKVEALYLKSYGLPHKQIAQMVGVTTNTLRQYFQDYQSGGIEALKQLDFRQPESQLKLHQQSIEAYFHEHPPATIKEAAALIAQITGIRRSPTQVALFLKNIGLRRRKVATVPAKADEEEQAAFKKTS
jgi:transposase